MKIIEVISSDLKLEIITSSELSDIMLHRKKNRDLRSRLKYISNHRNEFYITATLLNGLIIGIISLQLSPYEPNTIWIMGISTDTNYRDQGIATRLVNQLFEYARKNSLSIQRSSPTEDGSKYLSSVYNKIQNNFPDVTVIPAR